MKQSPLPRLASPRLAMLFALCIPGCTFDYSDPIEPQIPAETPAVLFVQLRANTQSDLLNTAAELAPGYDADGNIRDILTDLLVAGRPIAGTDTIGPPGNLRYEAEWIVPDDVTAGGTITVRAPALAGIALSAHTFDVEFPARMGPDTLFVAEGDPVILQVARPTVPVANPQWQLRMSDAAGALQVIISSRGYPPEQIVIPRSWFSPASSAHEIMLDIHYSGSSEFVPGQYGWSVNVHTQLYWTVVLSTTTAAGEPSPRSVTIARSRSSR